MGDGAFGFAGSDKGVVSGDCGDEEDVEISDLFLGFPVFGPVCRCRRDRDDTVVRLVKTSRDLSPTGICAKAMMSRKS